MWSGFILYKYELVFGVQAQVSTPTSPNQAQHSRCWGKSITNLLQNTFKSDPTGADGSYEKFYEQQLQSKSLHQSYNRFANEECSRSTAVVGALSGKMYSRW